MQRSGLQRGRAGGRSLTAARAMATARPAAFITGGNTGIGLETAKALALKG